MNAQKIGPILTAVTLMTLAGTASVCRAAAPASTFKKPTAMVTTSETASKMSRVSLPVMVQIGDAMLEEYAGGDPAGRMELFRGGSAAQTTAASRDGASHS